MKAVWDYGKDIPMLELLDRLETMYDINYARTTVATFLLKLSDKGFLEMDKVGRTCMIHPLKTEEEYKQGIMRDQVKFWYRGGISNLLSALHSGPKLEKEDVESLRRMLSDIRD